MKLDIVVQTAQASLVLPARARNLDSITQQAARIEQLKLFGGRLPCKSLNAPDGRGSIFGGGLNNIQIVRERFILYLSAHQLRASQDGRQRVVEVVRHAGCKLAERA